MRRVSSVSIEHARGIVLDTPPLEHHRPLKRKNTAGVDKVNADD